MKFKRYRVNKIILGTISFIAIATSINGCDIAKCGRLFCPPDIPRKIADVLDVPEGIFNYGGSTTFAGIRSITKDVIKNAHPRFELRYTEPPGNLKPGSGRGIKMLIEGQLDFSQSSRELKVEEIKEAKQRGFTLEQKDVALDGIALFVNPDLFQQGVRKLTLQQVQKIFIGEIQNWNQLGGPNLPIVPFSRNPLDGGTPEFFNQAVLEGKKFGLNVRIVRDTTKAIRSVASNKGGIGYGTAPQVINQSTINALKLAKDNDSPAVSPCATDACQSINQINFRDDSYPLTRKLFVIIKLDGGIDQKAGKAYTKILLTDEGQKLIKDAGFVPIRPIR